MKGALRIIKNLKRKGLSKMQEQQLRSLIIARLTQISILKGIQLQEVHFEIWTKKILDDYKNGLDLNAGFKKLETEKAYGGLDYAIFYEGARVKIEDQIEKEWQECLKYAKTGSGKVSARAAKALNSLGGMQWLKDSDPEAANWQRKDFFDIYKNIPEPKEIDFRCPGLDQEKIYLSGNDQKLLESNNAGKV